MVNGGCVDTTVSYRDCLETLHLKIWTYFKISRQSLLWVLWGLCFHHGYYSTTSLRGSGYEPKLLGVLKSSTLKEGGRASQSSDRANTLVHPYSYALPLRGGVFDCWHCVCKGHSPVDICYGQACERSTEPPQFDWVLGSHMSIDDQTWPTEEDNAIGNVEKSQWKVQNDEIASFKLQALFAPDSCYICVIHFQSLFHSWLTTRTEILRFFAKASVARACTCMQLWLSFATLGVDLSHLGSSRPCLSCCCMARMVETSAIRERCLAQENSVWNASTFN